MKKMKNQPFFSQIYYLRTDGESGISNLRVKKRILKMLNLKILSSPHFKCTRAESYIRIFKTKIRILLEKKYGLPIKYKKWPEICSNVVSQINTHLPSSTYARKFHENLLIKSFNPPFENRVISIKNLPILKNFKRGEKVHLLYKSSEKQTVGYKFSAQLGMYLESNFSFSFLFFSKFIPSFRD